MKPEIHRVQVPVYIPPAIPTEPPAPSLESPPVIVITPKDAAYYAEICERYEEEAPDEIQVETGLSESAACAWAIYGHTVQDEITLEQQLNLLVNYAESLRLWGRLMARTLENVEKRMVSQ